MDINKYKYFMIKLKKDGLIPNDIISDSIIESQHKCIELIEKKTNIKPPIFDYINMRNVQYNNKIKTLYLFTIQIDMNLKNYYEIYKDDETDKILNLYENYPHKYKYVDIDSEDEIYYYNFCKSFIKFDINDYDFFTDFIIHPMVIEVPLSPQ